METLQTKQEYTATIYDQLRWVDWDIRGWESEVRRCQEQLDKHLEIKRQLLLKAGLI